MAHIVTDRVLETTTTTGTGNITLAGAVSQFQDFDSQMANADTTAYFIKGISGSALTEWEVGLGTWNTGNTLSRTTVVRSSNANAAVNFSAGTKLIGMTFTPTVRQPGMAFTGALTPATNDLAALGSTSLGWSDLHLATGGIINWANGEIEIQADSANALDIVGISSLTIPQSSVLQWGATPDAALTHDNGGDQLILAGVGLAIPAGTTARPSLFVDPTGTLMTTPSAGAIEADATNFYGTTDTGNRGYVGVYHFIHTDATRTFTSNTNSQALFNSPTNGRITLETGWYRFRAGLHFGAMSATNGNRSISILGAGTATVANTRWQVVGLDGTGGTSGAAAYTQFSANASGTSVITATVGQSLGLLIDGEFELSVAGTMIPSTTMVTAAASTLGIGSYWEIWRIGSTSVVSVGQWD